MLGAEFGLEWKSDQYQYLVIYYFVQLFDLMYHDGPRGFPGTIMAKIKS